MKTLITTLIVFALSMTTALAQGPRGGGGPGMFGPDDQSGSTQYMRGQGKRGGGQQRLLEQLNLSAEQKEKLTTLRKSNRAQHKALRQSKKALKDKMRDAFKNDASESELRKLHREVQEVSNALSNMRFNSMMKMRKVLTAEQRVKFHQLKEERKKMGRGFGRKGPR